MATVAQLEKEVKALKAQLEELQKNTLLFSRRSLVSQLMAYQLFMNQAFIEEVMGTDFGYTGKDIQDYIDANEAKINAEFKKECERLNEVAAQADGLNIDISFTDVKCGEEAQNVD